MKKLLLKSGLFVFLFIPVLLSAQIPNPDFENWDSVTMHKPSGYRTYGMCRKVNGYKSPNAVRLNKDETVSQGPGAIVYGNPDNGFSGGVPVNGRPDSAVGYFKYHLVNGDSAWFLVFMKYKGGFLSQNVFHIGGSDTSQFKRLAFKINYNDTFIPDTVVIGVTSTDPDKDFMGSFLIADSIHLSGGTGAIQIPNGNFEQWDVIGFNNLRGWFSSNAQAPGTGIRPVSRTSDRVFTFNACKIQNVPDGSGSFINGYIMAGRQGNNGPMPGFAVQGRDSVLYCHYKCFPQGDTIQIAIMMFKNGTMIGMGSKSEYFTINTWSQAAIPINYWNSLVPDSAVIFCSAFQGGSDPHGPSVLYVDGLNLNVPRTLLNTQWILPPKVYPVPANAEVCIEFSNTLGEVRSLVLTDLNGKTICPEFILSENGKLINVKTATIPSGIWFYKIECANGTRSGKFSIQR